MKRAFGFFVFAAVSLAQAVIGPVVFTGSGLNDATAGGPVTTANNLLFTAIVDHAGTPDTIKWRVNGGSFTTGVAMTGSAQALSSGATIRFAATTGHTLNDQWQFLISIRGTLRVQSTVQGGGGAIVRPGDDKLNDRVDIRDFGAVCDGSTDDQAAISNALTYAGGIGGATVWIPRTPKNSTCVHSGTLTLPSGVVLDGDGTLKGTTFANQAVILTGTKSAIRNVSMTSAAVARLTNNESAAVWVDSCTYCEMRGVRIDGSPSAGAIVTGSSHGVISNNRISNTLADSITITGVSADFSVTGNVLFNSGDDCVSVNSYIADGARSTDVAISGNTCVGGKTRAFTTNGGQRINFTGNVASNIFAHGLLCAQDQTFNTYTPIDCSFDSNIVQNADNTRTGSFHSILIVQASGAYVKNNVVKDGPGIGVTGAVGQTSDHVYIHGNHLTNVVLKTGILADTHAAVNVLQIDSNVVDTAQYGCILASAVTTGMISTNQCNNTDTTGDAHGVLDLTGSTNVAVGWNRIGSFGAALSAINIPAGQTGVQVWIYDPNLNWDYTNGALLVGSGATFVSGYGISLNGKGLVLEDNHNIAGSGLAATINLFGGQITDAAQASIIENYDSTGGCPLCSYRVQRNGVDQFFVDSAGVHIGTCASGCTGITQLTGDVTAGPGSGSQAANVAKIQGRAVLNAAPANLNVLTWVAGSSDWEPMAPAAAVLQGAWTTYTPTVFNLSGTSITAAYNNTSKTTAVRIQVSGTSNGTIPAFSLPLSVATSAQTFAATITSGGITVAGAAFITGGVVAVNFYNNTAFANGVAYTINIQGVYENS